MWSYEIPSAGIDSSQGSKGAVQSNTTLGIAAITGVLLSLGGPQAPPLVALSKRPNSVL